MFRRMLGVVCALLLLGSCASLGGLGAVVQPPTFRVAPDRQPELRLLMPDANRPLGGAAVRLWAHVGNPNGFGLTLTTLDGTFFLEDQQAALVEFPLGLPLLAAQDTIIPLDISVGFGDVPRLATLLLQAADRQEASYRLDGSVGVDAGLLGRPVFGPMQVLQGTVQIRR